MQGLGDWWKKLIVEKGEKYDEHWTATMKK